MITLTRDQSRLSSDIKCEICKGVIMLKERFYERSYKLKTPGGGSVLITKLYHFNCVQRGQVMSPEAKELQKKLVSVVAERIDAEEELEGAEQEVVDLTNEESLLRCKLAKIRLYKGENNGSL